jgi:hypothetical protein
MATARGPLFSLEARGTLAQAMTYRKGPGATTVTKKPTTPKTWSPAQLNHRETIATLAAYWRAATPEDRATWAQLAIPRRSTHWAEFSRANLQRLAQGQTVTTVWPPTPPAPEHDYITADSPEDIAGDYTRNGNSYGYPRYTRSTPTPTDYYFSPTSGDSAFGDAANDMPTYYADLGSPTGWTKTLDSTPVEVIFSYTP